MSKLHVPKSPLSTTVSVAVRLAFVFCTLVVWSGGSQPVTAQKAPAQNGAEQLSAPLADLWLDVGLGPPLIEWFNQFARPDDIARANSIDQIGELDDITTGRKLVVFKSIKLAEERLPQIADRIDIIGYNLEHGPANPPDEQADPVDSIRRIRDLADQHGLQVMLGPDHDFAVSHGAAMAPYVDILVLQIQRVQTEPDAVRQFVVPVADQIKRANPSAQVSVQVRTEGDVKAITHLLAELEPQLDGISVLTSPDTVDTAVELVSAIRPSESSPDLSPVETPQAGLPSSAGAIIIARPAHQPELFRYGFIAGSVTTLLAIGFVIITLAAVIVAVLVLIVVLRLLLPGEDRDVTS